MGIRILGKAPANIIQRLRIEEMFMGRVSVSLGAGKMRDPEENLSILLSNPMNLFQGSNDIGYMFQHIDPIDSVEVIVLERVGENIQVMENVGLGSRVPVQTDGPTNLPIPATDIQYVHQQSLKVRETEFILIRCSGLSQYLNEDRYVHIKADGLTLKVLVLTSFYALLTV